MAYAFRSEAVSHDFAVFILIIAQLEVAALPESNIERGLPFPFVRIIQEYNFFEGVCQWLLCRISLFLKQCGSDCFADLIVCKWVS